MALTYGFYNSYAGDRKYDAMQISEMFDGILADGIIPSQGQLFAVTAGGGMTVNVGTGRAWFFHSWTKNDSVMMLTVPASDVSRPRIDAVVLEVNRDQEVRANSIKIVSGEAAVNPVKPTLVTTDKVHQYPLAYITVGAGVEEIKAENIENAVGLTPTPFATGVLETTPLDELWNQWEGEWDTWFANIKLQLSGDIVANLQGQIDALEEKHRIDFEYLIRYVDVSHIWTKTADYTSPGAYEHACKGSGAIAIIIGAGGGGGGGGGAACRLSSSTGAAGGGGGGGGGGYGGEIVVTSEILITPGTVTNVVVGAGGSGGSGGTGVNASAPNTTFGASGKNGGASSAFGLSSLGGNGGTGGGSGSRTYNEGAASGGNYGGGKGGNVVQSSEAYGGGSGKNGVVANTATYGEDTYNTYNGAGGGGGGSLRSRVAVNGGNGGTGLSGGNGGKGGNGAIDSNYTSANYPTTGVIASGYGNGGGGGGGAAALYFEGSSSEVNTYAGSRGASGSSGRVIIYERGVVE